MAPKLRWGLQLNRKQFLDVFLYLFLKLNAFRRFLQECLTARSLRRAFPSQIIVGVYCFFYFLHGSANLTIFFFDIDAHLTEHKSDTRCLDARIHSPVA